MGKRQNVVCRSETFYHFHTKLIPLTPPPPPIYLGNKAWSGLIMKQVINGISALAIKCVVNGTNVLFPDDDNSIV